MNKAEAGDHASVAEQYRSSGLSVFYINDQPGEIYPPHQHDEVRLFTLKGSAKVILDGKTQVTLLPGEELIIGDGQLHEAVVGIEGWEYLFACDPDKAEGHGLAAKDAL